MKKIILLLFVMLSSLTVTAQTYGEVNGTDSYDTTYFNTVSIYDSDGDRIAKTVFTYDTNYTCDNNIKVYNYTPYTGYVRLRVWVSDVLKVNKRIYVESYEYTYLDDVFRDCYSSEHSLTVRLRQE